MALQILVNYRELPVTYNVFMQEDGVYNLKLQENVQEKHQEYIPDKIIIRKKGKIWISDMDNYDELVQALTDEIIKHTVNT